MMEFRRSTPLSKTLNELAPEIRAEFIKTQAVVDHHPVWEPIRERVNAFHEALLTTILEQYGHIKPSQNLLNELKEALAKMAGTIAAINVTPLSDEDAYSIHDALMTGLQRKMKEALSDMLGEMADKLEDDPRMAALLPTQKPGKRDLN